MKSTSKIIVIKLVFARITTSIAQTEITIEGYNRNIKEEVDNVLYIQKKNSEKLDAGNYVMKSENFGQKITF